MSLNNAVNNTMSRWDLEAKLNFARRGRGGETMHRELWANGETMVGHEGALPNQMVLLSDAITIWKAGWKIVCD